MLTALSALERGQDRIDKTVKAAQILQEKYPDLVNKEPELRDFIDAIKSLNLK